MNKEFRTYMLIAIIGAILFIPFLGKVHLFDWDEINFAEAAREMMVTGDYMTVRIDYQPFHEKPPLFFWMQVASMKTFGVNEFAARLPNALIGIASLLFIFYIGNRLFDRRMGLLWVLTYIGSFLPHFYFKSGIIDPVFNFFIFGGVFFLAEFYHQRISLRPDAIKSKNKYILLAGVFTSLAVMTKGPVGYLLPFLTWLSFAVLYRKKTTLPIREFLIYSAIAGVPTLIWYIYIFSQMGGNIVEEFITYQVRLLTTKDAGHGGPVYYHFVILLLGCFPASIFALRSFRKNSEDNDYQNMFRWWMILLLGVVLVLFSIVETKIVHYSSLAYFPITFLGAYAMYSIAYGQMKWKNSTLWLLGIIGVVWSALFLLLPYLLINVDMIIDKITDNFTKSLLQTEVAWGGFEYIFGIFYLILLVISLVFLGKKKFEKGFFILFGSTTLTLYAFLPMVVDKVEPYTQGAPIEFYQSKAGEDCYIHTLGYKSYAHYYYADRKLENSKYAKKMSDPDFKEWLLNGPIDKTVYFVAKNNHSAQYVALPQIELLYEKNGFVFMKREPK
jgi:4-amino-4-deoxy-L-arabinose transferase-like glycosyltransferase